LLYATLLDSAGGERAGEFLAMFNGVGIVEVDSISFDDGVCWSSGSFVEMFEGEVVIPTSEFVKPEAIRDRDILLFAIIFT